MVCKQQSLSSQSTRYKPTDLAAAGLPTMESTSQIGISATSVLLDNRSTDLPRTSIQYRGRSPASLNIMWDESEQKWYVDEIPVT
jgi:hypothetical protein